MNIWLQNLLLLSIFLLTVIFVAAGVWLMLIFRDLRRLLRQWELISRRLEHSLAALETGVNNLPLLARELRDSAKIIKTLRWLSRFLFKLSPAKNLKETVEKKLPAKGKIGQISGKVLSPTLKTEKPRRRFFIRKQ